MSFLNDLIGALGAVLAIFFGLYFFAQIHEREEEKRVCKILGLDWNELVIFEPKSRQEESFIIEGLNAYRRNTEAIRKIDDLRGDVPRRLRDLAYVRRWMAKRFDRSEPISFRKGM